MIVVQRFLGTVCKDGLYLDITPDAELTSRRASAIALVLKCIPEPDYARIKERAGTFCWFVPSSPGLAWIERTHRIGLGPGTKVIYLPAQLEEENEDVVVGFVAVALAVVLLDLVLRCTEGYLPDREEEQMVAGWGFKNESRAFRDRDFAHFVETVDRERERPPTGQFVGVSLW